MPAQLGRTAFANIYQASALLEGRVKGITPWSRSGADASCQAGLSGITDGQ